jgi:Holliday junction resolvase RusA-like endonuclease
MIINITPIGKPRITNQGRFSDKAQNYYSWCDELKLKVRKYQPNGKLDVVFILPMPKSWSEKKKANSNTTPHTSRPDIDNLLKAFLDALCTNDSYVYDVHAVKLWGHEGRIIIN